MPTRVIRAPGAKRSSAPGAKRFPKFLQLPTEVQLMIWAAWREDQPPIRHYFCLELQGRGYAAFDPAERRCVKTTARTAEANDDDPLDPMEYKVRFTDYVTAAPEGSNMPVSSFLNGYTLSMQPRLKPAFAWVNFEKDVFIVQNTSYRLPGNLRFLLRNIGAKLPPPLDPGHWASRIRTLALYVADPKDRALSLPQNMAVWVNMTSLKTVLLIINGMDTPWYWKLLPRRSLCVHGFKHLDAPAKHYGQIIEGKFNECQVVRLELIRLLAQCGRTNVEVELVVDPLCIINS